MNLMNSITQEHNISRFYLSYDIKLKCTLKSHFYVKMLSFCQHFMHTMYFEITFLRENVKFLSTFYVHNVVMDVIT